MIIRPATAADVPDVLPMVARIVRFHEELDRPRYFARAQPQEMYRNWLTRRADDDRSVFLVAESNPGPPPELVGFLIATTESEIPIYELQEYGFIHDLWVDEAYRNEGTARQLVTLAVERFSRIGVKQIRLAAAWENAPARSLFARCGFRPATVEMMIEL